MSQEMGICINDNLIYARKIYLYAGEEDVSPFFFSFKTKKEALEFIKSKQNGRCKWKIFTQKEVEQKYPQFLYEEDSEEYCPLCGLKMKKYNGKIFCINSRCPTNTTKWNYVLYEENGEFVLKNIDRKK